MQTSCVIAMHSHIYVFKIVFLYYYDRKESVNYSSFCAYIAFGAGLNNSWTFIFLYSIPSLYNPASLLSPSTGENHE